MSELELENQEITTEANTDKDESGLKTALQKERQLRRNYEKQMKELETKLSSIPNLDPNEFEQLKQFKEEQERKAEEARQKELESKQQYETILKEKETKYQQELQQKEQLINELRNQIAEKENYLTIKERNSLLTQSLIKSNAFAETVNFLLKDEFVNDSLKFENGELTPVSKTGDPLTDGRGSVVTLDQWIETTLKPKFPQLFKATNISGTGMTPSVTSAKGNRTMTADDFLKLSPSEALNRARNS